MTHLCEGAALLKSKRRSSWVAASAVFAALFALLGLIPISRLVGISSFITLREALSPLIGMILGPVGGVSVIIGVFLDFALGRSVVFLGLDFLIDLAAALTAALAFTGRRKEAVLFPSGLIVVFLLSPSSAWGVSVGGLVVPFVWMHAVSVGVLAGALIFEARGRIGRLSWAFVGAVVFASTMAGHIAGGILTEYVYLSQGVLFEAPTVGAYWATIFYLYPPERIFLTIVGTAIALPVLRTLSRSGRQTAASRPGVSAPKLSGARFNPVVGGLESECPAGTRHWTLQPHT